MTAGAERAGSQVAVGPFRLSGAAYTIPGYAHTIASLAKPAGQYGDLDFDTPLGDTLPTSTDPETAANLAEQLYAALPRLHELAALLERRRREGV